MVVSVSNNLIYSESSRFDRSKHKFMLIRDLLEVKEDISDMFWPELSLEF